MLAMFMTRHKFAEPKQPCQRYCIFIIALFCIQQQYSCVFSVFFNFMISAGTPPPFKAFLRGDI